MKQEQLLRKCKTCNKTLPLTSLYFYRECKKSVLNGKVKGLRFYFRTECINCKKKYENDKNANARGGRKKHRTK